MYKFENITLRKIERSDLKKLLELKSESWFGTHRTAILNMNDQEKWFDSLSSDPHSPPHLFLIGQIYEGSLTTAVGILKYTHIDWINRKADLGWDVYKEYRGNGYGHNLTKAGVSFAKNILNLRRLNAEILENNIASQKCAIAAGFKKEGCKIKEIYKNGNYIDNQIYGILI